MEHFIKYKPLIFEGWYINTRGKKIFLLVFDLFEKQNTISRASLFCRSSNHEWSNFLSDEISKMQILMSVVPKRGSAYVNPPSSLSLICWYFYRLFNHLASIVKIDCSFERVKNKNLVWSKKIILLLLEKVSIPLKS